MRISDWSSDVCSSDLAMATIATGGFSTEDMSIGFYQSPAMEWIITVFMVLGGCTFVLFARSVQGDIRALVGDSQTRWYVIYLEIGRASCRERVCQYV